MFKFVISMLLLSNFFDTSLCVKPLDQYKEISILNRTHTSNHNLRFKKYDQYKDSSVVRSSN